MAIDEHVGVRLHELLPIFILYYFFPPRFRFSGIVSYIDVYANSLI